MSEAIPSNESSQSTASTPSTSPAQLTEFTLFPKLPLKLREKIWESALPGPRFIEITSLFRGEEDDRYGGSDTWWKPNTADPFISNITLVCREARTVVDRNYTKRLQGLEPGEPALRFDPNVDVIAILSFHVIVCDDEQVEEYLHDIMDQIGPIQKLAVDIKWVENCVKGNHRLVMGLKELMIVHDDRLLDEDEYIWPDEPQDGIAGFRNDDTIRHSDGTVKEMYAMFDGILEHSPEWDQPWVCVGRWVFEETWKVIP